MGHEVETMAYAGAAPWHIGETQDRSKVLGDEERRDWRAVMVRAGLDWTVELAPMFVKEPAEGLADVPDHYAVRRNTDRRILGVVGSKYRLLQNEELLRWFSPFVDSGHALFETAGSLRNGERVWALVKLLGDPLAIVPGDHIEKYVLLAHAHDGSLKVRGVLTPIRVVCANTLRAAIGDDESGKGASGELFTIVHTESMKLELEEVRKLVNLAEFKMEATAEQFRFLASRQFSSADLDAYAYAVLDVPKDMKDADLSTRRRNQLNTLKGSVLSGPGTSIPGVAGTVWALYNGATDYLTHEHGSEEGARIDSLWFGANAERARKALRLAIELAESKS